MTPQELTEVLYLRDALIAFPTRKRDLIKIARADWEMRTQTYKKTIEFLAA